MASVSVKIEGLEKIRAAIEKAKKRGVEAVASALYVAAGVVMTEAKQRAPVDLGPLRNSGYVTLPEASSAPQVELGFGGAAKEYALIQHERLEFKHEVGEAKYLENAINATPIARIIAEVARNRLPKGGAPTKGEHSTEPQ